jgi:hypothetical protein
MPIDLSVIGKDGRIMFREWKKEQSRYDTARVRKQFKDKYGNLDKYNAEIRSMNDKYRKAIKKEEKKSKDAMKELEKMRKEEELLLKIAQQKEKEAEKKKKEAALVKRRLNKETRKLELSKVVPRKSRRLLNKTKRTRCPNGTRKNKKTGNCEKKTKK